MGDGKRKEEPLLAEGNESTLRFTLEESVWFKKGQEVSELISISLDPDITIHEEDQYVIIKGFLQLTGEYKRHGDSDADEDMPASPKFVQMVEHRQGDVFEFIHRFPVDITIPLNRIKNTKDIEVVIESFDYHLPERSCLKLVADLTIGGLSNEEEKNISEEQSGAAKNAVIRPIHFDSMEKIAEKEGMLHKELPQEPEERSSEVEHSSEDLFAPFTARARRQPEPEKIFPLERGDNLPEPKNTGVPDKKAGEMKGNYLQNRNEKREEPRPAVSRKENSLLSPTREEETPSSEDTEIEGENLRGAETGQDEESSSSQPELAFKEKEKKEKKDGISLAEFFARKEGEEEVTRLKVCIVQQGETIETIAERYDVSVQSILKENDLDMNQDVQTGQVLYIPEHAVNKS